MGYSVPSGFLCLRNIKNVLTNGWGVCYYGCSKNVHLLVRLRLHTYLWGEACRFVLGGMKMKRFLSLVMAVFMVVGIIPVILMPVIAAETSVDKIVAIAEEHVGDTKSINGYTTNWCARFISEIAALAGESAAIPAQDGCRQLYNSIKTAGGIDVDAPQKGDIVFFVCTKCNIGGNNNAYSHVGIMLGSGEMCISGNYSSSVARHSVYKFSEKSPHTFRIQW